MKKILISIVSLFVIMCCFNFNQVKANSNRVIDNASLLTSEEEQELELYLMNVSQELNMDIVVLTTLDTEDKPINLYAADFYDDNHYGLDSQNSGVILCIDMTDRYYEVVNTGYAIEYYENRESKFDSFFLDYLSSGNYLKAFENFAEACRYCYVDYQDSLKFKPISSAAISLGIGAIVSTIICLVLKGKHKSVRKKYAATNYIDKDSLNINIANDILLNVSSSRIKRSTESSSSSSSSHFSSSSGVSHSSHGGHF